MMPADLIVWGEQGNPATASRVALLGYRSDETGATSFQIYTWNEILTEHKGSNSTFGIAHVESSGSIVHHRRHVPGLTIFQDFRQEIPLSNEDIYLVVKESAMRKRGLL